MHWRRQWHPTPVLLPGKSKGRRSLVGCSPWGCQESDTTVRLHFHFSVSCIGEGNGNPLQCSCLENPKERGAWWAAVYGVTQSRTQLKWLSSSIEMHEQLAYFGDYFLLLFVFHLLLFSLNSEGYISVQFSHSVGSDSLQPHESQHSRPPCPSAIPGVHSNLRPSSRWCHPPISSSVAPFSSCPQSLPATESFPMSQLFAWGG